MNPVDVCIAAGAHDAVKSDPVRWAELPRIGVQEDGEGGGLELRNCLSCNSTLAVEVRL